MRFTLRMSLPGMVGVWLVLVSPLRGADYEVFVSNEKAGTVEVFRGGDWTVTHTIPVGKRPRGLHASPDGRNLYVALSGTPVEPPPQLDTNGNPILQKYKKDDDDDDIKADKAADGEHRGARRRIHEGEEPAGPAAKDGSP